MKLIIVILSKLKRLFSSVKLAMILFILISAVSIIGTIIEQGEPLVVYKTAYGPFFFNILYGLGFLNVYRSWYFVALGGLFAVNLIVCSIDRIPNTLKIIFNPDPSFPNISSSDAKEGKSKKTRYYSLDSSKSQEEVLSISKNMFSKKFGKPKEKYDGKQSELYFSKNGIFRLSPYAVHLAIIIIIFGVILNITHGFRSYVNINEGLSTGYSYMLSDKNRNGKPVKLPFKIRLDKYTTKYYKDGVPAAYISKLSIIKNHKVILTKSIRVNHPLTYDGLTIYQVSYGHYLPSAARLLLVNLGGTHFKKRTIFAEPGTLYDTGIKGLKFKFSPLRNSGKHKIPFYISLYKNEKHLKNLTFFEHPGIAGAHKFPLILATYKEKLAFIFAGVKVYYYSGLEIAKNSYTWIIWIGSIFMIISLFFSFYFNHKTLRMKIYPSENGEGSTTEILMGSNKKSISYYDKIDKTITEFKNYI
ncbi:cytochrome c biogenesis protein ResB [Candidatus Acidulodesulfobacterium sp. H_13]|uniref:cytochrome c biogenesis protein ResB n=1 Tax=Candidatus Acidulodesulfobacterium sp. H_13 TaxID=3395470 RepID=UPI003AF93616